MDFLTICLLLLALISATHSRKTEQEQADEKLERAVRLAEIQRRENVRWDAFLKLIGCKWTPHSSCPPTPPDEDIAAGRKPKRRPPKTTTRPEQPCNVITTTPRPAAAVRRRRPSIVPNHNSIAWRVGQYVRRRERESRRATTDLVLRCLRDQECREQGAGLVIHCSGSGEEETCFLTRNSRISSLIPPPRPPAPRR